MTITNIRGNNGDTKNPQTEKHNSPSLFRNDQKINLIKLFVASLMAVCFVFAVMNTEPNSRRRLPTTSRSRRKKKTKPIWKKAFTEEPIPQNFIAKILDEGLNENQKANQSLLNAIEDKQYLLYVIHSDPEKEIFVQYRGYLIEKTRWYLRFAIPKEIKQNSWVQEPHIDIPVRQRFGAGIKQLCNMLSLIDSSELTFVDIPKKDIPAPKKASPKAAKRETKARRKPRGLSPATFAPFGGLADMLFDDTAFLQAKKDLMVAKTLVSQGRETEVNPKILEILKLDSSF